MNRRGNEIQSVTIEDQAVGLAKRWGHPEVDSRHVLAVLMASSIVAQGSALSSEELDALLAPRGTAIGTPSISCAAAPYIARCTDRETARVVAAELLEAFSALMTVPQPAESGQETVVDSAIQQAVAAGSSDRSDDAAVPESLEQILAELEELVGLDEVKHTVRDLIAIH